MTDWSKVIRGEFVEFARTPTFQLVAPIEFDTKQVGLRQDQGDTFYVPADAVQPVLPRVATGDPLVEVESFIVWCLRTPHVGQCFYYSQRGAKCLRCFAEDAHRSMREYHDGG